MGGISLLEPLVEAGDEFEPYGVLLLDNDKARMFYERMAEAEREIAFLPKKSEMVIQTSEFENMKKSLVKVTAKAVVTETLPQKHRRKRRTGPACLPGRRMFRSHKAGMKRGRRLKPYAARG